MTMSEHITNREDMIKRTARPIDKTSDRRRKRALRNKERLIGHQKKLLDNFGKGVNFGFSEENWNGLANLYRQISTFISPEEYLALGQVWRDSFSADVSPSYVEDITGLIKHRLDKSMPDADSF